VYDSKAVHTVDFSQLGLKLNYNRNLVFRFILSRGKTSHREISISLNMSMPTVLAYTQELKAMGLIEKAGLFESTGGRRAGVLVPNAMAKVAIGFDITYKHVSLVVVDLLGQTHHVERIQTSFHDHDEYYGMLGKLVGDYIERHAIPTDRLIGVGLSIPGIIDASGLMVTDSHALRLQQVPCARFSTGIPYPCIFMNDANAACLAELSAIESDKPIVYLSLSNSVGGGIIWNNRLYYGDNQRSGEFGHMILIPDGKMCYCGEKGHVDAYCSALELVEYGQGSLERFFALVRAGDETCRQVLDRYLDHLAIAVNNIRMAFDCQVIVGGYVGGFMTDYIDLLRVKTMAINLYDDDGSYIRNCTFRYEASAVGAAMHHINTYIATI
jgi:predicted NBD/HSP70 family sugar kinase